MFINSELEQVYNTAKNKGFRVFTFRTSGKVAQIFITDGEKIGTCQGERFRGVKFGTVHKPNKSCGTGFGIDSMNIEGSFIFVPHWASQYIKDVKKYKDVNEYILKNKGLDYYFI